MGCIPEPFALAAKGDKEAFSAIVREYESAVYNYALSICHHAEDAFDISQDSFLKLWRSLPKYRGECSPKTWILGIVRHTAIDCMRAKKRRLADALYTDDGQSLEIPDAEADPAKDYEKKERAALVHAAIRSLPPELAETLYLREFEDFSYDEIARILKIRTGTVKSRISRARDGIKKYLEERNFSP